MSAVELLACTLTYRSAQVRSSPIPDRFESKDEALSTFFDVLMHEAHESMSAPLDNSPLNPYLHPVDIHTMEPGIVDSREGTHVLRCAPTARVKYTQIKTRIERELQCIESEHEHDRKGGGGGGGGGSVVPPSPRSNDASSISNAEKKKRRNVVVDESIALAREEKKAATAIAREERARKKKAERATETQEERAARLLEAKCKREARKARRATSAATDDGMTEETRKEEAEHSSLAVHASDGVVDVGENDNADDEDDVVIHDVSLRSELASLTKRRKRSNVDFFAHPLPHHRHLLALQLCDPSPKLVDALLDGRASDAVEIIQGPPGTGKTRALVDRLGNATGRVFLCAPTNVGVVNLYKRAIECDSVDASEVSLVLPAERIPQGTLVRSNDPRCRVVCSTISSRSGPVLLRQSFENVFVDEAAMCQEAWVWTLLRSDVHRLVLAGDVKQLPAMASVSGVALHHERSLMERLIRLRYANVVTMTTQNRMAPQILAFPNRAFYDNALRCGPFAPKCGRVDVVHVDDGVEEVVRSSYHNAREAEMAVRVANDDVRGSDAVEVVILTPYAAQALLLLSFASGRQVHTLDSFQGREASTVVLSVVRDGSSGLGFLCDDRRLAVALTRARERMVIVVSGVHRWPACSLRSYVEEHS